MTDISNMVSINEIQNVISNNDTNNNTNNNTIVDTIIDTNNTIIDTNKDNADKVIPPIKRLSIDNVIDTTRIPINDPYNLQSTVSASVTEIIKNTKNKLKQEIMEDLIFPNNKNYIASSLRWTKFWGALSGLFITLKHFFAILVVPALTFTSTTYTEYNLNYFAGIASLSGIALEKMGQYCAISAKKRTEKMNSILETFGINDKMIDTTIEDPLNLNGGLSGMNR